MRKLIYFSMLSLDGFIEGTNRNLDWVIVDEQIHTYINAESRKFGAYLYGRRMYDLMAQAWPHLDADASQPAYIREFSTFWKDIPKIVFSKTLQQVEWNSQLVRLDPVEEVARLKHAPGQDLCVGGSELASSLMQHGLVDEYQLYLNPVILGSGTRLFQESADKTNLSLVSSRVFDAGVVLLNYSVDGRG